MKELFPVNIAKLDIEIPRFVSIMVSPSLSCDVNLPLQEEFLSPAKIVILLWGSPVFFTSLGDCVMCYTQVSHIS